MLAPSPVAPPLVLQRRQVASVLYIPGVMKAADLLVRPASHRYANWQQRIERALEKARELRRYARQISPTHYKVKSEDKPLVWYDVYLSDEGYLTCTCPAGEWGKPCKHAGRVALRREREFRMPRLCDLPPTPWDLFAGDDLDEPDELEAPYRPVPPPDPGDFYRVA